MGLPPTSPRLKFVHTHPRSSPVPRRPPRHPTSPSSRSRSLELLDQDEKKAVLPVVEPEPLPRPRSKSLDGLLDEENEESSVNDAKTEDTSSGRSRSKSFDGLTENTGGKTNGTCIENVDEIFLVNKLQPTSELSESKVISEQKLERAGIQFSEENESPTPVPRNKAKVSGVESTAEKIEVAKIVQQEDTRISSSSEEASDGESNIVTRSKSPNRYVSMDMHVESAANSGEELKSGEIRKENVVKGTVCCDSDTEIGRERLLMTGNEKPTLLKAKSCGTGLDIDESFSSNEYKPTIKGQGSLLSLPVGAEPKRKRNFMDKCVNKVRSFIKK